MEYSSINQIIPVETSRRYLLAIIAYIYRAESDLARDLRVAMVFKLLSLFPAEQLRDISLPGHLGKHIMKDLEAMQQDMDYLKQWAEPLTRLAYLKHEKNFIRQLTQRERHALDDHISLNYSLKDDSTSHLEDLDDLVSNLITTGGSGLTTEPQAREECVLL